MTGLGRTRRSFWIDGSGLTLALAVFLAAVEWRSPYFFLQDDNRDGFLPLYVESYRALAAGEISQINFHQSLGLPTHASGQAATLFPLPYLGVAASKLILGHVYGAIEVLVFLYFMLGGLGALYVARTGLGLSRAPSLFLAVSWLLHPYLVYLSTSWISVGPVVALLPWMTGFALVLARSPGWPAVWGLAATTVLFFFTGIAQWFVYTVTFVALLLVLAPVLGFGESTPDRWRPFARGAAAAGLALLACLPLLLPMASHVAGSARRDAALPYGEFASRSFPVFRWVRGLVFPFDLQRERELPATELRPVPSGAALSHLGAAPLLLVPFWLAGLRARPRQERGLTVALLLLGVLAVAGATGALSPLLYRIPVWNRFRWPFKLLPYFNWIVFILAAYGLERFLNGGRDVKRRSQFALLVVALQAVNLVTVNFAHTYRGFLVHTDAVPLSEPALSELSTGRVFTIGWRAGFGQTLATAPSLGFSYATLLGLQHFAGYDPLMPSANSTATLGLDYEAAYQGPPDELPISYLRRWGVRWYVIHPDVEAAFHPALTEQGVIPFAREPHRVIYRDAAAWPLAHWQSRVQSLPPPPNFEANRLWLAVEAARPDSLILAVLANANFDAFVDNRPVAWQTTVLQQVAIPVPEGLHQVELRYTDPLLKLGTLVSLTAFATMLLALLIRRWRAPTSAGSSAHRL